MIILDATIVNVALPSIKTELGFSNANLSWVINAFLLTYAGFRLLGGRLGDVFGHRKLFLLGVTLFTLASLTCALAHTPLQLIAARALQGLAGALVGASALSLIVNLFPEGAERAKAIGVYGSVCSGGGTVGLLLGGTVTTALSWHWIFLINLPVGATIYLICTVSLKDALTPTATDCPDIAGAITITASLLLIVYTIIGSGESGWVSVKTLGPISGAAALLILFRAIEARVRTPLVPLDVFRRRNLLVCTIVGLLSGVAGTAGVFISLYLQLVLKYSPLHVSLALLPLNLSVAAASLGLSARLVTRFGSKWPLVVGLLLIAAGLALLERVPVNGSLVQDLLPAMLLMGLGTGIAANQSLLVAMNGVASTDSGLISGIVGTSNMMGTALGLAVLASVAAGHSRALLASGVSLPIALNGGYHVAYCFGAASILAAATLGATLLHPVSPCHRPLTRTVSEVQLSSNRH
jgi:MFS family permease